MQRLSLEHLPETVPDGRWRSLSEFVVGACNRVAHAAAMSVVEEPGAGANPLVIHGPVGTGKTHLLEGVFAGLERQPDGRPCFVTAEEFTTRFVSASQHGKMAAFRRQFRDCGALLLDDLHFLASRKATQAEFLHTFDALVADGRQVVVTTDCHPRLADELMPELVDRLLGGAIWGLMPPEHETRLAILRKKAASASPPIPEPVLKSLAPTLRGNVRELEGAINSVRHFARVTGRPVDAASAHEALGDLLRHAIRAVTINDVDAAVCAVLRLARRHAAGEVADLGGHTSADAGDLPLPQAHRRDLRRDQQALQREDAQHRGRRREEGPRLDGEGLDDRDRRPRLARDRTARSHRTRIAAVNHADTVFLFF